MQILADKRIKKKMLDFGNNNNTTMHSSVEWSSIDCRASQGVFFVFELSFVLCIPIMNYV